MANWRRLYPTEKFIEIQDALFFYSLREEGIDVCDDIAVDHHTSICRNGGKLYSLPWPRSWITRAVAIPKKKDIQFYFRGLQTQNRLWLIPYEKIEGSHIEYTKEGRDMAAKHLFKDEYMGLMSRSRFALCPRGVYLWSYRVFEAALCGAIPVIDFPDETHRGLKCYKNTDKKMLYNSNWALDNFKWFLVNHSLIKAEEYLPVLAGWGASLEGNT